MNEYKKEQARKIRTKICWERPEQQLGWVAGYARFEKVWAG